MADDYRNTKYCPVLGDLSRKKQNVKNKVLGVHPKAKDMHAYIAKKELPFKKEFGKAYNLKCAYCGISVEIIPMEFFEIDHFIPKEAVQFGGSKANAGYIENLVFACRNCNRAKHDFECPAEDLSKINPDSIGILHSFMRDDMYYIRINDNRRNDRTVIHFYEKIKFGSQLHRIDYLLMNMLGLCNYLENKGHSCGALRKAIDLLRKKRNIMG